MFVLLFCFAAFLVVDSFVFGRIETLHAQQQEQFEKVHAAWLGNCYRCGRDIHVGEAFAEDSIDKGCRIYCRRCVVNEWTNLE